MSRNRAVSLLLVALFLWVTGCTSYTQIHLDEVAGHGKVRVTTTDSEQKTVRDPRVEADSIKGLGEKKGGGSSDRLSVSVPLETVALLESGELDQGKTGWLLVGLIAATAVVALASTCGEDSYIC